MSTVTASKSGIRGSGAPAATKAAPASAAAGKAKMKKVIKVLGALTLVFLGARYGWALWANRTPAPTAPAAVVAKFVGTDKFVMLPIEEQTKYIEALEKDRELWRDLPDDQRRAAWENMREVQENKELDQYAKLTPKERQAFLDKQIDEQEKRRKEREQRRPEGGEARPAGQGGGGPPGGWQGQGGNRNSAERQKARLENRSPARRAQSAQMRADQAARRAERGLPSGGWGGGGGGGPGRGGPR